MHIVEGDAIWPDGPVKGVTSIWRCMGGNSPRRLLFAPVFYSLGEDGFDEYDARWEKKKKKKKYCGIRIRAYLILLGIG